MGVRVLLIEDDQTIAEPLAEGLGHFGLAVHHVGTGSEGLRGPYGDVVLLDLGLPDMDGIDVCRGIRQTSDVPIIILSARGEEADRVLGLELGADDYLAKPFSIRELVARVRAVTRRTQRAGQVGQAGQAGPVGPAGQVGRSGQFAGADAYGPGTGGGFGTGQSGGEPVGASARSGSASSARGAESWSRGGESFGGDSYGGDSFGGESLRSDSYGGESFAGSAGTGATAPGPTSDPYEPADATRQFDASRSFETGPADTGRSPEHGSTQEPRGSRRAGRAHDANTSFGSPGSYDAAGSYGSAGSYDSTGSFGAERSFDSTGSFDSARSYGSTGSFDTTRSFEAPDPAFDPAPPPEAAPEGPSGPLVVDRRTRQVWVGNSPVALTPKEFELLALLTEDPGAVYSRQQILDRVWDPHYEGPTKTLDVHVATLRRKLGNSAWIQTLRGVGFRLAVHTQPPAAYQAPGPQAAYR
ncbi:winged-helix domain-containing protein [Streptomyces acidicola]|uniref:winged-helix domain-containing protein n=1 Tax=Streptomyces acidicola TaxID=2596892 RepID=UPI0037A282D9